MTMNMAYILDVDFGIKQAELKTSWESDHLFSFLSHI